MKFYGLVMCGSGLGHILDLKNERFLWFGTVNAVSHNMWIDDDGNFLKRCLLA